IRLRARGDNSRNYAIRYGDDKIDFRRANASPEQPYLTLTYSAQNHRFWKISNEPGSDQVSFWTRGAADDWLLQTRQPVEIPLDAMEILFVAGTYNLGS